MPLDRKYSPYDLRTVLKPGFEQSEITEIFPGLQSALPIYYSHNNKLVLESASDNTTYIKSQSLEKALESINNIDLNNKIIIIPLIEKQKILGFIPKNHWVTLHYDVAQNKATLIDSRPWYTSYFYPTSPMKTMLSEWISSRWDEQKAQDMQFEEIYLGVQHNDVHCGAWTNRIIRDLAGLNSETHLNMEDLFIKIKEYDEIEDVINYSIDIHNQYFSDKVQRVEKLSFFQILVRLFSNIFSSNEIKDVKERKEKTSINDSSQEFSFLDVDVDVVNHKAPLSGRSASKPEQKHNQDSQVSLNK